MADNTRELIEQLKLNNKLLESIGSRTGKLVDVDEKIGKQTEALAAVRALHNIPQNSALVAENAVHASSSRKTALPSASGTAAGTGVGIGASIALSWISTKIGMRIMTDPEAPMSKDSRNEMEAVMGAAPPGAPIAAAVLSRFMMEGFGQFNTDAIPMDYNDMQREYELFMSGDW